MWQHASKLKGQIFLGNYEFSRGGKRQLVLKNQKTGRELKPYTSHEAAKKDGFRKV